MMSPVSITVQVEDFDDEEEAALKAAVPVVVLRFSLAKVGTAEVKTRASAIQIVKRERSLRLRSIDKIPFKSIKSIK